MRTKEEIVKIKIELEELKRMKTFIQKSIDCKREHLIQLEDYYNSIDDPQNYKLTDFSSLKEVIYHYISFYSTGNYFSVNDIFNKMKEQNCNIGINGKTPLSTIYSRLFEIYKNTDYLERKKINGKWHYKLIKKKINPKDI